MVKKLTKAALLAAATAFLLAGFPACSSDDDDGDSNPTEVTAELAAEVGELTAGTPKTVEATVKVDGDTFSTKAKSIGQGAEIPEDSFALEADNAEVSAATLVEWVDDSTARISFTVTANEDSEGGKIHALIKAGTLATCTEVVTTNSVIYTVEGKTPPAGLTKTVRFFNDADETEAIHTVTVATGEKLTEDQLATAESKLTPRKARSSRSGTATRRRQSRRTRTSMRYGRSQKPPARPTHGTSRRRGWNQSSATRTTTMESRSSTRRARMNRHRRG